MFLLCKAGRYRERSQRSKDLLSKM